MSFFYGGGMNINTVIQLILGTEEIGALPCLLRLLAKSNMAKVQLTGWLWIKQDSTEMEASGWLVITPPGRDRPLWLMCSGPTNWMYQKNFLTAA